MADKPSGELPHVRFHYIKSNYFRVIHVDGALGGVTPNGNIHCALYSERQAIPQITEHELPSEQGPLGPGKVIEGKAGFVREIDVDLIMSREKAEELRLWLVERIEEFDRLTGKSETKQ